MINNEVCILRRVKHPNIVQLVEEYITVNELYLVMELIKVCPLLACPSYQTLLLHHLLLYPCSSVIKFACLSTTKNWLLGISSVDLYCVVCFCLKYAFQTCRFTLGIGFISVEKTGDSLIVVIIFHCKHMSSLVW